MNAKFISMQTALGYARTEHALSQAVRNTSRFNTPTISLSSLDTLYDPRTSSCLECRAQNCTRFHKQLEMLWIRSKRACKSKTVCKVMWRWAINTVIYWFAQDDSFRENFYTCFQTAKWNLPVLSEKRHSSAQISDNDFDVQVAY
jgi:hypothetical protein